MLGAEVLRLGARTAERSPEVMGDEPQRANEQIQWLGMEASGERKRRGKWMVSRPCLPQQPALYAHLVQSGCAMTAEIVH
jgi:hypothetical protein